MLEQHHGQYLRARAVADEVAAEREYQSALKKSELFRFGFGRNQQLVPTLVIPIWSVRGAIECYQLRPDKPRLNEKGKPRKYEMKAGSQMLLDVHPRLTRPREADRPALIGDPVIPFFITEGIPKADSAVSIDLCCIALPGVWNWRGSNQSGGKTALADWESIALNGRRVYIAFDSDVMEKRQVYSALARLKPFLESRKATVRLIYLPAGGYGEKVGLDDFIAREKAAGKSDSCIRDTLLALATDELRMPPDQANSEHYRRAGMYGESPQGLVRFKSDSQGVETPIPLTNFRARIVREVCRDNGADSPTKQFEIEAVVGERNVRLMIPSREFAAMNWMVEHLGVHAITSPGSLEHVKCAIQWLSGDSSARTVYSHSGWREINAQFSYLHAGGAIGPAGPIEGIEVDLSPKLSRMILPVAPRGDELRHVIEASFRLFDLGPDRITIPAHCAVWRSILGGSNFSLHFVGPTGAFKSELAALVQRHFGAGFDASNLPASWSSTANALEALAFEAKDAVLTIDDFAPTGVPVERARLQATAERLLRSQGNTASRGRLDRNLNLRPDRPPRGLILSTGEDVPGGQSARARMAIIEIAGDDIDNAKLTACQRDGEAGLYAQALSAFIQWLAQRMKDVRVHMRTRHAQLRDWATRNSSHRRTPSMVADLFMGGELFLDFARESEALDAVQVEQYHARICLALGDLAAAQAKFQAQADPVDRFLELLASAIGSGKAHVADCHGLAPREREAQWGWRSRTIGAGPNERTEWQPQGIRVGWVDANDLYLERNASLQVAQTMVADGNAIAVSQQTLAKRMHEKGLLSTTDPKRETLTVRRTIEGCGRPVLHLRANVLSPLSGEMSGFSDEMSGECRVRNENPTPVSIRNYAEIPPNVGNVRFSRDPSLPWENGDTTHFSNTSSVCASGNFPEGPYPEKPDIPDICEKPDISIDEIATDLASGDLKTPTLDSRKSDISPAEKTDIERLAVKEAEIDRLAALDANKGEDDDPEILE